MPDGWRTLVGCSQEVLCFNLEGECIISGPEHLGHQEFCREVESALVDIKSLSERSELPSSELVTVAVDKVITACQEKVSLVAFTLQASFRGDNDNPSDETIMSSMRQQDTCFNDALTTFVSSMRQTHTGTDLMDKISRSKLVRLEEMRCKAVKRPAAEKCVQN